MHSLLSKILVPKGMGRGRGTCKGTAPWGNTEEGDIQRCSVPLVSCWVYDQIPVFLSPSHQVTPLKAHTESRPCSGRAAITEPCPRGY